MLHCCTTRESRLARLGIHTGSWLVDTYFRNDAAIQRAEELAKAHGVKTAAYKVDGMLAVSLKLVCTWY